MASSLASQLAQVRSHNSARLAGGKAAQRVQAKSYLFPASIASSQDYQTLHGLALNGWDELSSEDTAFSKWDDATGAADLLFGDSSKDLDRLTKTKEENTDIDNAISEFLCLIGDRLLDRSAGKCIEWLIRRFRAHEYNVETLLSAFIPFHESAEFARMLSILELKDKPHFAFLLPVQKQAVPLPSSVLLSALLAPPSTTSSTVTLRWIMGLVQRKPISSRLHSFQRHRHTVLSFWLSTIVKLCSLWSGADDMQLRMGLTRNLNKRVESRDDDAQLLLTVLLPAVLEFTSSTDLEKEASIYGSMAICAIANAFSLSFEAGSRIISSLASSSIKKERGRTAILIAAACVVQQVTKDFTSTNANDDVKITPKLIQSTVALKFAHLLLTDLSFTNEAASYDLDPFFLQLLFGLTDAAVNGKEETLIQDTMEAILGGQKVIGDRAAIRAVTYMLERSQEKKVSALIDVISRVRQRRPQLIEGAFKSATKNISSENRAKLDSLMGAILARAAGATVEGTTEEREDAIVWLGMQDANPTSRLTSLRTLLRNVQAGKASAKDKFVQDSLASMLSDDNANIVGTLYAEHELLMQSLGVKGIVEKVQTALHHTDGDMKFSRSVTLLHIRFLSEKLIGENLASEDEQWDIWFNVLWPKLLLFKKNRKSGQAYYAALSEAFSGKAAKGLNVIDSRIKEVSDSVLPHINDDNLAKANENLVNTLSRHMATSEEADYEFLITVALPSRDEQSSSNLSSRLLALLTLGSLLKYLQGEKCERVCTKIVARLQAQDASYGRLEDYEEQTVYEAIYSKPASERTLGKVYITLFLELAKHIPIGETHFLDSTASGSTISRLFAIIITHLTSEMRLANMIVESLLLRMQNRSLAFLASIWTASQDDQLYYNAEVRLMSLRYAHAFLNAHIRGAKLSDFQTIIPAFLVALHDGEKSIRVECLSSLQTLQAIAKSVDLKSNESETDTIYGYDVIYGPQTAISLSYLDLHDVREFLQAIVQARQSFVNDSDYLAPWMNHNLIVNVKEDGKKVAAHKGAIIHYLSTHILCWDNLRSRLFLLESLSGVSHERKLLTLQSLLEKSLHDPASSFALQTQLLGLYDKSVKSMIKSDAQGVWTLFKFAIQGASRQAQICAASVLQSQIFSSLPREKQREITLFLANLIANSAMAMPKEIRTCLYSLPVQPDMIASISTELRKSVTEALLSRGQPANKRNRIDVEEEQQDGPGFGSLSTLTELLEATLSRKPEASMQLVAELFECVRLGTELHLASISTNAEHIMQVAMSNLTIMCGSMDANLTAEVLDPLRIDLLINVVKTPCRPYTFQQALDLLALIGRLSPDLLVHHSMPIFTFVGSTMLQRDDEHSFTVIERTLQSILPPVVADIQRKQSEGSQKAKNANKRDASLSLLQAARPLLCVFTDAATHVPRHRRQNFFHLLASVMGMDDFLSPICLLLVDRQAYKVAKQMTDDEAASALQLPLSLFERAQDAKNRKKASIDIQLSVLAEVWNEAMRTWQHKSLDPIEMQEHVFLDCVRHIDTEHEGRKSDPIKRIIALLRFSKFAIFDNRNVFEEEREAEDDEDCQKRDSILHAIIQNAILLTRVDNVAVASASQEALDEVMTIVSVSTLKHVVNSLVHNKDALSKRSGLQIFANAIGAMMKNERKQASDFTPNVIQICSSLFESTIEDQTIALDTLLAICEEPEPKEHSALSENISRVGKLALQSAQQGNSLISERALDVLRKMGETLGPRLIPKLAELVQLCKSIIKRDGLPTSEDAKHQQEGALSVIVALLRSVPTFMSSHLSGIFNLLIDMPIVAKSSGAKKVLANIVKFIDSGEVLQAIFDVHNAALAKGSSIDLTNVHIFSLDVIQLCTRSMDKRKTTSQYKAIFRFLLECFDVRRKRVLTENDWTKLSDESLSTIEGKAVGVFVRLVFRLNETTFRPLFLRLCDWALIDLTEEEEEKKNDKLDEQVFARQTVLYKALNALLEELGELISHYYVNVLDATIETLNNGKTLPESLWEPMLTSIKLSSKTDKGTFWNQMRVNKMLNALIAQLRIQESPALSSTMMERLLSDTICNLCATVSDENCIKTANSSLLEVARQSATPSIYSNDRSSNQIQQQSRLTSIRILDRLWRTKGCEDDLLTLVPETVPSIAELLQESDEDMQQAMNGLVSAIEEILGEGLDAYLQ